MPRRPPLRGPRQLLSALTLLLCVLAVACGGSEKIVSTPRPFQTAAPPVATATPAPPAPPAPAPLSWSACGRFECAVMPVPLDYAEPTGRQMELSLVRQKARDAEERIGSLVVNPGGPGASGIDFLRDWAPSLPREIQARFDVVGFDPRGVGESTPLLCHDNIQELVALEPSPRTPAQWQRVEEVMSAFGGLCAERGAAVLPHLGTENAARDLDLIRQALDEEKLTYFGYSYGTILGAVYADLFPGRVRAMVLDGAADISLSVEQFSLEQARGFEGALDHFFADCRARRCLPSHLGDPADALDDLIARAGDAPIPAPQSDRPAGPGETLLAVIGSLYTDRTWPDLARAIERGLSGDGSPIIRLVDRYLDRLPDGSYDNSVEMYNAVTCLDYVFARDAEHYIALATLFEANAPRFGRSLASGGLTCAYWQAAPAPLRTPHARGAPPILVIGTTGDPATPYKWALSVSKQLESAVLLTNNAEGHTAYRSGSGCIDDFVRRYLVALETPPPGSSCGDAALATPLEVAVVP